MWLDTRDASSWDRNPADFTSVGYYSRVIVILCISEEISYVELFTYTLMPTGRAEFLRRPIAFQLMC